MRLAIVLFFYIMFSCQSQENPSSVVERLLADLKDNRSTISKVMERHVYSGKKIEGHEMYTAYKDSFMTNTLKALREKIYYCERVQFKSFQELEKDPQDTLAKPFIGTKDRTHAFYIFCDSIAMLPVLIRENKISTFIVMAKGKQKYFMEL